MNSNLQFLQFPKTKAPSPRHGFGVLFLMGLLLAMLTLASPLLAQRAPHVGPFLDTFDRRGVNTDVWQVATWSEHGGQTSRDRVYVEDNILHMEFINDSQQGYLSSAMQTWDSFLYGRWEARLKPSSVPGVLNSMYTIDWRGGAGTRQEVDIEFLTYTFQEDSGEVHLAVHASGLQSWNIDIPLDFNPSDDFRVWGFEITPDHIEWFVDDTTLFVYEYSERPVTVNERYQLKFNVWTQVNWINGPPEPDVLSTYKIDWVRFTPLGETPLPLPEPTPEPVLYYGFPLMEADFPVIDTEEYLGYLQVEFVPWVYSYNLESWLYLPNPEQDITENGGSWLYLPHTPSN